MLHTWCVVFPKSPWARESMGEILASRALAALCFRPRILLSQRIGAFWLASASANAEALGIERPYEVAPDGSCAALLWGLPLDHACPSNERIAAHVHRLLHADGPDALHERAGGAWNAVHVSALRLDAVASFCGYGSLCLVDGDDYFAIGNRASMLAPFATRSSQPTFDLLALSWLFSMTTVIGERTAFAGVRKVPPGQRVTFAPDRGAELHRCRVTASTSLPERERGDVVRAAIERLSRRVRWCLERKLRLVAHVTGGKDSRAILALLANTGEIDRIEQLKTYGDERNGDVIVARELVRILGVTRKHEVEVGGKGSLARTGLDRIHARFVHCAFKYEGQLTPHDGASQAAAEPSPLVTLTGGGGEMYRQKGAPFDGRDREAALRRFRDWEGEYDACGVLTAEARAWQEGVLRSILERLRDEHVLDLQPRLYIDHRLSNWGAGHLQSNASPSLPVLVDLDLARAAQSVPDIGEDLHYEILRQACPALLGAPFLNHGWSGRTLAAARRDGFESRALKVRTRRNFPWQHEYYRRHRDRLIDIVLERADPWRGILSRPQLEAFKRSPIEPFDQARVKMLFAMVMSSILVAGEALGTLDFDQCHATQVEGNAPLELRLSAGRERDVAARWFHDFPGGFTWTRWWSRVVGGAPVRESRRSHPS